MKTAYEILEIMNLAKQNKTPFPQTFMALKNADVISYDVSWIDGFTSSISTADTQISEPELTNFIHPKIGDKFLADEAKLALKIHQQGKSNYIEWIKQMAKAGVAHYSVIMANNHVIYYNIDKTQSIIEEVPQV